MSELQEKFDRAGVEVKQLSASPGNDNLLKLYGLYKQATKGDATGDGPGMFDMVGKAKFAAWSGFKGTSKEAAMQSYVDLVESLKS